MTSHYDFFATAPKYTEGLLLDEIKSLGAEDVRETVGGVNFSGSLELAYNVCLWSRIANRVLLNLHKAKISSEDDLYNAVYSIPWHEHFDSENSFVIDFNASGSIIKHSQFGAQKCKDAIVDQFRHDTGARPDVDKQNPDIRINVHVKHQNVSISLDLSGHSLHQRGYRKHNVAAPLKENLAAAVLIRSGWTTRENSSLPLIDPMCGSGTLLIEAALIKTNTAPGLLRTDFGFSHWKQQDANTWQTLRDQADKAINQNATSPGQFLGFDIDPAAIEAAVNNTQLAGVASLITYKQQSLSDLKNTGSGDKGFLVTNAPYGERLSDNEELLPLYETLGEKLKSEFAGWQASVITSDMMLAKATRLYAKRQNKLYNGKLLCNIFHFDIRTLADQQNQPNKVSKFPEIDSGLANRLTKNIRHLKKWAGKQNISCYRIYDADIPEFNFALDIYKSDQLYYVFQEYTAPSTVDVEKARKRATIAKNTVLQTLDIPTGNLFIKQRKKQPGSSQYEKLQHKSNRHIVYEGKCAFYVNFEDYLDTGLFLDHRITREIIQSEAKGKSFLNLFCYTGTASVHAALGGAKSTTSVDMSATYLSWCEDNFMINKIPPYNHKLIKANCLDWIKSARGNFDLIFVDPPTFSNSKNMSNVFDVQRDYIELLKGCARLLAPQGKIIFSTNFRKFKFDTELFAEFNITDITQRTLSEDFAKNRKIHQCWIISKD